ncbi:hypothetical protein M3Y99_01505300 [Aphelenchoides fujianensis]|nr:hypothetical protein M3Y99_01505300 [Aphelenchoides fujianensis]
MSERTLKDDSELAEMLAEHNCHLRKNVSALTDRLNAVNRQAGDLQTGLQGLQGEITEMKRENYVQEVIIDEGSDLCSRRSAGIKPPPPPLGANELQEKVGNCAQQGLQMISQMFKPVSVELPTGLVVNAELISNDIYEPIDRHLIRDLPPIVGTPDFNSWDMHEVVKQSSEINEITVGGGEVPSELPAMPPSIPIRSQHPPLPLPVPQLVSNYADELKEQFEEEITPPASPQIQTPTAITFPPVDGGAEIEGLPPISQISQPEVSSAPVAVPSLPIDVSPLPVVDSVPPPPSKKPLAPASLVDELKRLHLAKPEQKAPVKTPVQQAAKPAVTSAASPANKEEESDDSFDELFKQVPANVVLPAAKSVEPPPDPKSTPQLPPVDPPSAVSIQVQPQYPQEEGAGARKATKTLVKRSIFDTSSSSDDEKPKETRVKAEAKPTPQPTPRAPAPAKSAEAAEVDDEMPKTVLNSVSNDFSSRLNAALLRRPQQPTYTAKPQTSSSAAPASSSSSDTNEVDTTERQSVTALRGKLGASITRAHTHGKANSDETSAKSKSSGDEHPPVRSPEPKAAAQPSAGKNDLIQTLKARPRPPNRRDPTAASKPPPAAPPAVKKAATKPAESEAKTSAVVAKPPAASATPAAAKKPAETPKKSLFDSDSDEPF